MKQYRTQKLDASSRYQIAVTMLQTHPTRQWGCATALARQYGVSRTWIYQIAERAAACLQAELAPKPVGRPPTRQTLEVDQALIHKAIVLLPLLTGSVRQIQLGLQMLFGVQRSVGHISAILQKAGQVAAQLNQEQAVPQPILGEADEIFQGRQPCLSVLDQASFLVLNLKAATGRDSTHWGVTFLELAEQGVHFADLVADGAKGLRSGWQAAGHVQPVGWDLFHLLREAHPLTQSLERQAYGAIDATESIREDLASRKPHYTLDSLPAFLVREARAISCYDHFCDLLTDIHLALAPCTPKAQLQDLQSAAETLLVACELLQSLEHPKITSFANKLLAQQQALLAPLQQLNAALAPYQAELTPAQQAYLINCWRAQQATPTPIDTAHWPAAWQAFWRILAQFHRSSSLVEALHSWLRPFLQIHRGMPAWLLPLLQLFWNHHRFTRGKRAGATPLELAGVIDPPAFEQVLSRLVAPSRLPTCPVN